MMEVFEDNYEVKLEDFKNYEEMERKELKFEVWKHELATALLKIFVENKILDPGFKTHKELTISGVKNDPSIPVPGTIGITISVSNGREEGVKKVNISSDGGMYNIDLTFIYGKDNYFIDIIDRMDYNYVETASLEDVVLRDLNYYEFK